MQLVIQSLGFDLTPALREAIETAAQQRLDRFDDHIVQLTVRVYDINGVRGGADKACRIHSDLGRACALVVEAVHEDLYAAITQAFAKAERAAEGRLNRHRGPRGRRLRASIRGREPALAAAGLDG